MGLVHHGTALRATVAIGVSRAASGMSRRLGLGEGTTIGGVAALSIDPQLLTECSRGRRIVLVSGTNGKTTTTRLIAEAWGTLTHVASNASGANLPAALVTALASDPAAHGAVLEVDEGHLRAVSRAVHPAMVVMLNLSRDQLDRVGEVRRVAADWRALASELGEDTVVVANADDPMTVWAASPALSVVWVASGQPWTRDSLLCPACGALLDRADGTWACHECRLGTPRTRGAARAALIDIPGAELALRLRLPGRANRSNAIFALAAAAELGVAGPVAMGAIENVTSVAGRYEQVDIAGVRLRLLLAKNPAGWLETLDLLGGDAAPLVIGVNARAADGRDTSWLWDVPFERLRGRRVLALGDRRTDLAVRLDHAGVQVTLGDDLRRDLPALRAGGEPLDTAVNYTAFQDLRERAHAP
jgi:UDP-N-acetylmuramyl tripeptide synthase